MDCKRLQMALQLVRNRVMANSGCEDGGLIQLVFMPSHVVQV